jgi:hypothetical protein
LEAISHTIGAHDVRPPEAAGSVTAPPSTGRSGQRLLAGAAGVAVLTIAVMLVFPGVGVVAGVIVAVSLPFMVVATWAGFRIWRGTISHTVVTSAPPGTFISLRRAQAMTPCAILAMDGLLFAFTVLVTFGVSGGLAEILGMAGGAMFLMFSALMFFVALTLRPRMLLPGTMRAEMSA